MGDVIEFQEKNSSIIPKTLRRTYKRRHFQVTFLPKNKKWQWTVEVVTKSQYSDIADTMQKAVRAAEKCIDRIEETAR